MLSVIFVFLFCKWVVVCFSGPNCLFFLVLNVCPPQHLLENDVWEQTLEAPVVSHPGANFPPSFLEISHILLFPQYLKKMLPRMWGSKIQNYSSEAENMFSGRCTPWSTIHTLVHRPHIGPPSTPRQNFKLVEKRNQKHDPEIISDTWTWADAMYGQILLTNESHKKNCRLI